MVVKGLIGKGIEQSIINIRIFKKFANFEQLNCMEIIIAVQFMQLSEVTIWSEKKRNCLTATRNNDSPLCCKLL